MAQAKEGDVVRVHYTGRLDDGTVFDSSRDRDPLEFTLGDHEIIPGFEEAVVGMSPGEHKSAHIAAADAYGQRHEEMVATVARDTLPAELDPRIGQQIRARQPDGTDLVLTVTSVSSGNITLDANHPLAGRDLVFDIELVAVL
jgi:peptidylprolyl isomerase